MISQVSINDRLKISEAQLQELRAFCPEARFKTPKDYYAWGAPDEEKAAKQEEEYRNDCEGDLKPLKECVFLANISVLFARCPFIHGVQVKQVIPFTEERTGGSVADFAALLTRFEETAKKIKDAERLFNEKCQVHIGGNMLLNINELMLKEDSCTDALQSELNNGWRIISVCVQPDGRRPDYVLGRYNPTKDASESEALR
ncbi:hypothetical protein C8N40_11177 [Pontibacter mucosus]|uniref:Uncharacterized protein n=1 Tax=Pontibacter mucosus TaxID=1649266 RepID=A0A2T5YD13_9BACT|nr:hypothetical protein [Pontibacter mucosus]PTX14412.1 hypothetical protein C8N40_11177 [Pontibacter mucosus]